MATWRHCQFFGAIIFPLSNLVSGPSFMWLKVLKIRQFVVLIRNPENMTTWALHNIWRLEQQRDTRILDAEKMPCFTFISEFQKRATLHIWLVSVRTELFTNQTWPTYSESLKAGNIWNTSLILEDLNLWQWNTEFVRTTKKECCLNTVDAFAFSASAKLRFEMKP